MDGGRLKKIYLILITLCMVACSEGKAGSANYKTKEMKEIYFAGGCFWGTEHFFKQLRGVVETEVGYANGPTANPSYQDVCASSGHAETVKIVFDDDPVRGLFDNSFSFSILLVVKLLTFFSIFRLFFSLFLIKFILLFS